MLKDKTTILQIGGSSYILIPSPVRSDSKFPFLNDDNLILEIQGKKIVLTKQEGEINDN